MKEIELRKVDSVHPPFHESELAQLFHTFWGVRGGTIWLKNAPGTTLHGEIF